MWILFFCWQLPWKQMNQVIQSISTVVSFMTFRLIHWIYFSFALNSLQASLWSQGHNLWNCCQTQTEQDKCVDSIWGPSECWDFCGQARSEHALLPLMTSVCSLAMIVAAQCKNPPVVKWNHVSLSPQACFPEIIYVFFLVLIIVILTLHTILF